MGNVATIRLLRQARLLQRSPDEAGFQAAVKSGDWDSAAKLLYEFSKPAIAAHIKVLQSTRARDLISLRDGALRSLPGAHASITEPIRLLLLDDEYQRAVAKPDWPEAGRLLNTYDDEDIRARLVQLRDSDPAKLIELRLGAYRSMPDWHGRVTKPVAELIPAAVKAARAREADAILDATRELHLFLEPKVKGGTVIAGHAHFLKGAAWTEAFAKHWVKAGHTKEEGEAEAAAIQGFHEGSEIFLNDSLSDMSTVMHEAVHLYSDARYGSSLGDVVSEATTQYFANLICRGSGVRTSGLYAEDSIAVLAGRAGNSAVAKAYFNGDFDPLENAVGLDLLKTWIDYMKAKRFVEADRLLISRGSN